MPVPPDHRTREGLAARERRLLAGVGAAAVALLAAAVMAVGLGGSQPSGAGCVRATFPGPVGAEHVNACGRTARSLCAHLGGSGYGAEARRTVAVECRRAHLGPELSGAYPNG